MELGQLLIILITWFLLAALAGPLVGQFLHRRIPDHLICTDPTGVDSSLVTLRPMLRSRLAHSWREMRQNRR